MARISLDNGKVASPACITLSSVSLRSLSTIRIDGVIEGWVVRFTSTPIRRRP